MTLTDLIKSAEEKLANPDLTLGTRRREEAILHHLTSLERTVTELVSQNTEMYVDLCEMGDEPKKNTERVHLYTDDTETQQFFLGGNMFYELTIDKMVRHKWPEEKPENLTWVLIRNKGHFGNTHHNVSWYVEDEGFYVAGFDEPFDGVIHWWNLPEVTE